MFIVSSAVLLILPNTMDLMRLGMVFMFLLAMHSNMIARYHVWKMWKRLPRRRWWVRPVNRPRRAQGFCNNLLHELITSDHEEFFDLFRMLPEQFDLLVKLVHPFLRKHSIRTPLSTKLRVAVTLM